jgi:tRNA A37 N6-isopentenylltransferase MiaA
MQPQANDRDLMAPETEPTDAELHLVMSEALALAMERKKMSDAMMRQRLLDEVAQIRACHQSAK